MRAVQILVAVGVVLAAAPLAQGAEFSDPKALVTAIYAEYQPGVMASDPSVYYSQRLKAIFEQASENRVLSDDDARPDAIQPVPRFNPFLPDVSALLFDVSIGEPVLIGDRALVNVSYHNFDHPRLLSIAAVREDGGWKVDDVASLGDEDHWLLSWALIYDPLRN
ncbi:hypothetical protein [Devosia aquimaris]|uniref:hypothetical protein n=1 Tax=Devosia aquimaris TaxID=2866214 RepID=UPI001CD0DD2A|nr:hypothetical protein [Devosia sp. CJK-A8-3]